MGKGFSKLLFIGLAAIVSVYVLLYTPVYDTVFGVKPPATKIEMPKIPPAPKVAEKKPEKEEKKKEVEKKVEEKPKEKPKVRKPIKYAVLRDPFEVGFSYEKVTEKEGPGVVKKKGLNLQGIFIEGKSRYAIIDDNVVREGGRVSGWKVSRILSDRVVMLKGKQRVVLKIKLGVE